MADTSLALVNSASIIPISKRNMLIVTPEGEDYFPSVLVQQKGENVRLTICDTDDITPGISLRDVLSDDIEEDEQFIVSVDDLNGLLFEQSETIIPRLVELFSGFSRIQSDDFMKLINILHQKYSVDYILGSLVDYEETALIKLLESDNPISMFDSRNLTDQFNDEYNEGVEYWTGKRMAAGHEDEEEENFY